MPRAYAGLGSSFSSTPAKHVNPLNFPRHSDQAQVFAYDDYTQVPA